MVYKHWLTQINKKLKENEGSGILGVFDSGIGGLTVIPALQNSDKKFDIVYLGDTIHFPYGEKDFDTLAFLVISRISNLLNQGCEVIAIACNTASIAFNQICEDEYINSKIIGTINCTADFIHQHKEAQRIGIIGTDYTVKSCAYQNAIKQRTKRRDIFVAQSAEQTLVWAIENGHDELIKNEADRIVEEFTKFNVDTFVLGCTHYGHIKDGLKNAFEDHVVVINPSEILGSYVSKLVTAKDTQNIDVMFTGKKPKLSGMFEKYNHYVHSSREQLLPFDQIWQMRLLLKYYVGRYEGKDYNQRNKDRCFFTNFIGALID